MVGVCETSSKGYFQMSKDVKKNGNPGRRDEGLSRKNNTKILLG